MTIINVCYHLLLSRRLEVKKRKTMVKERYQKADRSLTNWIVDSYGEIYNPETKFYKDSIDCGRITKSIYLGSYELGAKVRDGLKLLGVSHILLVGNSMHEVFPDDFQYKSILIADKPTENIEQYFDECISWIDSALMDPNNVVFIHCKAGMSRSATITIAYLMRAHKLNFIDAVETVRQARYWIIPNSGFKQQLLHLNSELRNKSSKEDIVLYDQCFNLMRTATWKRYKLEPGDKSFILESFEYLFGTNHSHTIRIKKELDNLTNVFD